MLDTVESRGAIKRGSRPFFRVTRWWLGISAIVLILTSAESAAPHAECATAGPDWPSPGSFWTVEETRTGSFGNGSARDTLLFLGERPWKGELHLAISDGPDVVYFDRAHRLVARERDGAVLVAYEPADPFVGFPLFVGRRWSRPLYVRTADRRPRPPVERGYRVEAYEQIETVAGRFAAYRILLEDPLERVVYWWSPLLGIVIREERARSSVHRLGVGTMRRDLVTYSPADGSAP